MLFVCVCVCVFTNGIKLPETHVYICPILLTYTLIAP